MYSIIAPHPHPMNGLINWCGNAYDVCLWIRANLFFMMMKGVHVTVYFWRIYMLVNIQITTSGLKVTMSNHRTVLR
jgi:hypothetical protein